MGKTFKPIIDEPDCFAIEKANFKPLIEFVEPSKGTKILLNFWIASKIIRSSLLFRKSV